ncbi:MAG TPA: type I-B CRISPR-associated protein Cas7/Cst2/DevR [Methanocorpusculum sp.]|nr:type I-B CRISPR-associated protein Cas7/Cst2/DevR [Methanocorpusculum sp.]HJK40447.1 type I-B CRISPR-associated protein Cas7/Cst2/DevR [Methanocorpusculum sp.]HJK73820.1 type I-B CRISPR-associated protein Cas7/Cst2/DevR [Methanocorpusculum sp.]
MTRTIHDAKSLTISFLTPVSFASLNGSDKEADNISSIKKITVGTEEYPYVSSQALRRALRNQLAVLGWELSEGVAATIMKGAATTKQKPAEYIDDDLFGYMGTESANESKKGKATKRTSVVRVCPLISLDMYQGDLDFGTNYMSVQAGGNPNIFETEIHSGMYRGTLLIELDRVGCGDGFEKELAPAEKAKRVKALLQALKNLWGSGRQSRFLADISPKFIAAAFTTAKNPIFLESLRVKNGAVQTEMLEEVLSDYDAEVIAAVFGERKGMFSSEYAKAKTIGEAFTELEQLVDKYYTS